MRWLTPAIFTIVQCVRVHVGPYIDSTDHTWAKMDVRKNITTEENQPAPSVPKNMNFVSDQVVK